MWDETSVSGGEVGVKESSREESDYGGVELGWVGLGFGSG